MVMLRLHQQPGEGSFGRPSMQKLNLSLTKEAHCFIYCYDRVIDVLEAKAKKCTSPEMEKIGNTSPRFDVYIKYLKFISVFHYDIIPPHCDIDLCKTVRCRALIFV